MIKYGLLFLLTFIVLYGCASTNPNEILTKIYSTPEAELFSTTADIISSADSRQIGGFISSEIDKSDPIFVYGDSMQYRSSFELYNFKGKKNRKYTINVSSFFMNAGFGLDKHSMIPLVYILDSDGNRINDQPQKIETFDIIPAHIEFIFIGEFNKEDNYYILVGSDNRFAGKKYSSIESYLPLYYDGVLTNFNFSSDLLGFPYGEYEIKILVE